VIRDGKDGCVLLISADLDVRDGLKEIFLGAPWLLIAAVNPNAVMQKVGETPPVIILIDTSFYEEERRHLLDTLNQVEVLRGKPVVSLTAEKDRDGRIGGWVLKGLNAEEKASTGEAFLVLVDQMIVLSGKESPKDVPASQEIVDGRSLHPDFGKFKKYLVDRFARSDTERQGLLKGKITDIYSLAGVIGMAERDFAKMIAEFLRLPHVSVVDYENLQVQLLPGEFCRWNLVIPILDDEGNTAFLLSNPFDWELIDVLKKNPPTDQFLRLIITDPPHIRRLLNQKPDQEKKRPSAAAGGEQPEPMEEEGADIPITTTVIEDVGPISEADIEQRPVVYVSNNILYTAVIERASDIHIEPKEKDTVVRYRIDGDLRDIFHLKKQTGTMVISRLKALAGIDITERMKPQDGSVEIMVSKRTFKLRLATTSTPNGESLIIRVLEPTAKPKDLSELGMTNAQVRTMADFSTRRYGLILVVGPTGSGKTTTIYSFLSHVDTKSRSLISVEDPVEYRIPNANQQQVNDKAGVTFDALLKSSVRQDPDILYMGEVRDTFSARISVDFASTGHMAISTLHTNNATTAIFRLERLGVVREVMAEALLGIIAQRLLKKLCPFCKAVKPITQAEAELLSPFTDDLPTHVAHPVGCAKCREGYAGREGIYEIIAFDQELLGKIRDGIPISEFRDFIHRRGDYLISHHAVEKVKNLIFTVKDVYEKVLVEEIRSPAKGEEATHARKETPDEPPGAASILVVEDDEDNQLLISKILTNQGYDVSVAGDGIDALMILAQKRFDLILSDINMPNLDGFKFLELINQKGIKAPLMFLTARSEEEDEVKGLELGALDYLKKPIKKDALLLRVKRALGRSD
jgi:type II secretory ATPase GspE/PulE/Tfp pilus assembly ATPase PilB-like protein